MFTKKKNNLKMIKNEKLKYYTKPLDKDNQSDWFDVAKNCSYIWQDMLDKKIIDGYFKSVKKTKFIIYNQSKLPIAIYYSNYKEFEKRFFIKIKVKSLDTIFTGLFIIDKYQKDAKKIIEFTEKNIVSVLIKSYGIDYLIYNPSPLIAIKEKHSVVNQILFPNKNKIRFNGLIINKFSEDILSSLNKRTRYEVKKGLKYFYDNNLFFEVNKEKTTLSDFKGLENLKSTLKGIPYSEEKYLNINQNDNFKFFKIRTSEGEPLSIAFIRIFKNFATFRYNSSSSLGRNYFQNKVLIFKIYYYLKNQGIDYFILGNIYDIEGVRFFKESMSNQTIINNDYIKIFSNKARLLTLLNKL